MNDLLEPNLESEEEEKVVQTAVELRAQYNPEMGEDGKPRGHWMNLIIDDNRTEVVQGITAPFEKSNIDKTEVVAGSLIFTNPTKPIEMEGGKEHAFVRVEPRENEEGSTTVVFERESPESDNWINDRELPTFPNLQDPFYCGIIEGYQIFGGVQTNRKENGELSWKTVFYRYKDGISELFDLDGELSEPFVYGPTGMKDIRLHQISDGRIAVFTRPQGEFGGRGKIGYFEITSIFELEPKLIEHVEKKDPKTLIEGLFCDQDWGGVNELHALSDGRIGVIGHIACMEEDPDYPQHGIKNYYAISFIFNPETKEFSSLKIIATAEDFPEIEGKKEDIGSVIFSGGIERQGGGQAIFYGGVKDMKSGYLPIQDPFNNL